MTLVGIAAIAIAIMLFAKWWPDAFRASMRAARGLAVVAGVIVVALAAVGAFIIYGPDIWAAAAAGEEPQQTIVAYAALFAVLAVLSFLSRDMWKTIPAPRDTQLRAYEQWTAKAEAAPEGSRKRARAERMALKYARALAAEPEDEQ